MDDLVKPGIGCAERLVAFKVAGVAQAVDQRLGGSHVGTLGIVDDLSAVEAAVQAGRELDWLASFADRARIVLGKPNHSTDGNIF